MESSGASSMVRREARRQPIGDTPAIQLAAGRWWCLAAIDATVNRLLPTTSRHVSPSSRAITSTSFPSLLGCGRSIVWIAPLHLAGGARSTRRGVPVSRSAQGAGATCSTALRQAKRCRPACRTVASMRFQQFEVCCASSMPLVGLTQIVWRGKAKRIRTGPGPSPAEFRGFPPAPDLGLDFHPSSPSCRSRATRCDRCKTRRPLHTSCASAALTNG
ncbi:hypothetical protein BDY17DRAFT_626 [Neohortaea acidophila]|uniref:Uncharacterized protein n=1 Tax=Neohortaea acidophila TaxID=245834 RepID=A0A6A6Q5S0_9PEZI|nr:uncharacterized protein BDY17DRAFT_626 [Neohortaea acidophila]KAF2486983.1 hypothetical protein BDY17DRAFT_626 [Neohortaea acidophila]